MRGRGLKIAVCLDALFEQKSAKLLAKKKRLITRTAHLADGRLERGNSKHRVYAGLTKEFTKEAGVDSKYTMCAEGA